MRSLKYAGKIEPTHPYEVPDMAGFFRKQEEKLAAGLLKWKYRSINVPIPDAATLQQHAAKVVDDAHRIARERGSNVASIIKELVEEIRKR